MSRKLEKLIEVQERKQQRLLQQIKRITAEVTRKIELNREAEPNVKCLTKQQLDQSKFRKRAERYINREFAISRISQKLKEKKREIQLVRMALTDLRAGNAPPKKSRNKKLYFQAAKQSKAILFIGKRSYRYLKHGTQIVRVAIPNMLIFSQTPFVNPDIWFFDQWNGNDTEFYYWWPLTGDEGFSYWCKMYGYRCIHDVETLEQEMEKWYNADNSTKLSFTELEQYESKGTIKQLNRETKKMFNRLNFYKTTGPLKKIPYLLNVVDNEQVKKFLG